MNIQFFNGWYFLFLFLSFGGFAGLYFLLRGRSERTVKALFIRMRGEERQEAEID